MANVQINQLTVVATSAVSSSANFEIQDAGQPNPQSRQLSILQIIQLFLTFRAFGNVMNALSSGVRQTSGSAAVTGTLAINTGLTTLAQVMVTLRGLPASSASLATWSPLASSGWFSALVFANATATNVAPAASTIAQTVDWIAVGT